MDADGLPIIGSSVDYRKVDPINQKRTVSFLNHFVIHTAGFLNRFSTVCEEKLSHLSTRLQRLETQMTLLEGKLSSVPGLDDVTVSSLQQQQQQSSQNTTTPGPAAQPTQSSNQPNPADPQPENKDGEPTQETTGKPTNTISQHPSYAKFFKMLSVGVPSMAVKQKMVVEGLNPDYLDTPDAPVSASGAQNDSAALNTIDAESDFSEPEEENSDSSTGFSD